ncbi:Uncharacterised protein [uncultured archaeon]|nr:Uncharacterised protein [uncultured archaeon]
MRIRIACTIIMLALLLAGSAAATKCAIFVVEDKMTINNANIYLGGGSRQIGLTSYNLGLGQNCWIGEIPEGEHTLSAKWWRLVPKGQLHEGSATVSVAGTTMMHINIATKKA